jgi:hypothetical protein
VLLFFIAGLLYLLRFERVDNLGAYSIPSGDRPSHSICFHSLWQCRHQSLGERHFFAHIRSILQQMRLPGRVKANCGSME